MKHHYHYKVNNIDEEFFSIKNVDKFIKTLDVKPIVIKYEHWNNGKTSKRVINVKGNSNNFTIL